MLNLACELAWLDECLGVHVRARTVRVCVYKDI